MTQTTILLKTQDDSNPNHKTKEKPGSSQLMQPKKPKSTKITKVNTLKKILKSTVKQENSKKNGLTINDKSKTNHNQLELMSKKPQSSQVKKRIKSNLRVEIKSNENGTK